MTRLPKTMRAAQFSEHGGPEMLRIAELPVPRPAGGEVLLQVRAAGVNPADVGFVERPRSFVTGLRLPAVPGWDVAGVVVALGAGTQGFAPGDEVFGLSRFPAFRHGTFAEFTTVPATHLALKPATLSWEQAGALPVAGLTALQAFDAVGGIQPGQLVLIEAAAGGVGHVAVQVAKAAGASVAGTASAPRHGFLKSIGVDVPVDYTAGGDVFAAAGAVDGVLLSRTEAVLARAAEAVRPGGFMVTIQQEIPEQVAALADSRGVRHADILVTADGAGMRCLADLVRAGKLRAEVSRVFPLDQVTAAFRHVDSRHTVGKVVLMT